MFDKFDSSVSARQSNIRHHTPAISDKFDSSVSARQSNIRNPEDEDFKSDDGTPEKEDIYLLKMTCPSTVFIHALRVPPDIASAREAIRWVNWDIAPEEFSVQT